MTLLWRGNFYVSYHVVVHNIELLKAF